MSIEAQLARLVGDLPDRISEGVALGTGLADGYDLYESAIGEVAVAFNPRGVSSVDLADPGFEDRFRQRFGRVLFRAEAPRAWGRYIPTALESGTPGRLPVDFASVTSFQAQVLTETATIPRGEVRPYAWVASRIDRPKAVRAVGSALSRNPVPLIIPCHRVVRSDGHIGAYSLGGSHNKRDLLAWEGANPGRLDRLAALGVKVQGNIQTRIYCHPTCHRLLSSREERIVDFGSLDEASEAGFRPCQVCRPG